jgi:hypothetical protein
MSTPTTDFEIQGLPLHYTLDRLYEFKISKVIFAWQDFLRSRHAVHSRCDWPDCRLRLLRSLQDQTGRCHAGLSIRKCTSGEEKNMRVAQ